MTYYNMYPLVLLVPRGFSYMCNNNPLTPLPLFLYPSPSIPTPCRVQPAPTISLTPAFPDIVPPPYIALVSAEWKYTGQRYPGGGVWMTTPPPPPLTSLSHPVADKYTYPTRSSSSEYFPDYRPPCGGYHPGSSQYEVKSTTNLRQTGVYIVPTHYKSSQKSGGLLPPALKFLTSLPTDSTP